MIENPKFKRKIKRVCKLWLVLALINSWNCKQNLTSLEWYRGELFRVQISTATWLLRRSDMDFCIILTQAKSAITQLPHWNTYFAYILNNINILYQGKELLKVEIFGNNATFFGKTRKCTSTMANSTKMQHAVEQGRGLICREEDRAFDQSDWQPMF